MLLNASTGSRKALNYFMFYGRTKSVENCGEVLNKFERILAPANIFLIIWFEYLFTY